MIVWSIAGLSPNDIAAKMKSFDLGDVQCFKQEDKEQIMDIVDNYRTGRKVPVIAAASPVLLPPGLVLGRHTMRVLGLQARSLKLNECATTHRPLPPRSRG
jgi:hypothetical protein